MLDSSYGTNSSDTPTVSAEDNNTFHLFPCLNPPSMAVEIAGWNFPFAPSSHTTREDGIHGPAGGRFSLGKFTEQTSAQAASKNKEAIRDNLDSKHVNSGFCVGVVVESDMGERSGKKWRSSGMDNMWVLGEPFFRGTGIVFDPGDGGEKKARMGFRVY